MPLSARLRLGTSRACRSVHRGADFQNQESWALGTPQLRPSKQAPRRQRGFQVPCSVSPAIDFFQLQDPLSSDPHTPAQWARCRPLGGRAHPAPDTRNISLPKAPIPNPPPLTCQLVQHRLHTHHLQLQRGCRLAPPKHIIPTCSRRCVVLIPDNRFSLAPEAHVLVGHWSLMASCVARGQMRCGQA